MTSPGSAAVPVATSPRLKAGALGAVEATVTCLSDMAPAMSLFFTIAFMAAAVGAAIPFVFLVAMIGILFTANSLAQFARIMPSAGSFITYITASFGPTIGTILATFLILGYTIAAGSVNAVLGGWTSDVLQRDLGISVNWVIVMLVLVLLFGVLLVVGVQVSTRAALILFVFEAAVLLLLGIVIVINKGASLSATPFAAPESSAGIVGFATAFALANYAFVGWESAAPLAEETDNPRRNVPLALILSVIILAIIFIFVTYAAVVAYGVGNMKTLANDQTPFATLARVYLGPLRGLVDIAGITSISASYLALTNTQGRILFHGGRAGIYPGALGMISRRFQTPYVALITYMVMMLVGTFIANLWLSAAHLASGPYAIFGTVSTFGSLPLIIVYGLTNIALIVYTVRYGHAHMHPITHFVLPAIGAIVLLAPLWDFFQTTSPPFDRVPVIVAGLFVFSLIYGLVVSRVRPEAAKRVGEAFNAEDEVLPPVAMGEPGFVAPAD